MVASPIVSELETQEQLDSYECWFRAKVEASLAQPGLGGLTIQLWPIWM